MILNAQLACIPDSFNISRIQRPSSASLLKYTARSTLQEQWLTQTDGQANRRRHGQMEWRNRSTDRWAHGRSWERGQTVPVGLHARSTRLCSQREESRQPQHMGSKHEAARGGSSAAQARINKQRHCCSTGAAYTAVTGSDRSCSASTALGGSQCCTGRTSRRRGADGVT